jgi:hypothetical protein
MNKYLVETVSMFRMRYVIECESAEHAMDVVTMREMEDEFSQEHLDEVIVSARELKTKEEYLELFDVDNDYCKSWTEELKLKRIHKVNYEKV